VNPHKHFIPTLEGGAFSCKIGVLDDKRAWRPARELGLEVIGTLSIPKKLYENGVLAETLSTIYRHLIEIGFYIDMRLFDKVFQEK